MSNLLSRVLVAIIAIPLVIGIILSGGWIFSLFVAVLCTLGVQEFYTMSEHKAAHPQKVAGMILAFLLPLFTKYSLQSAHGLLQVFAIVGILWVMAWELTRNKPHALLNVSTTLAAIAYVGGLFSCLVLLREVPSSSLPFDVSAFRVEEPGSTLILAMFISIWVCDSAAYFVGMSIGKHKIFPRVSPKKSWEGSIGGFLASAAAMWAVLHFMMPDFPPLHAIILGAIIGVVGQIGDFAESLLKRDANMKDSSSLIPGHGGVLDRFDSVLFVAPAMYLYLYLWLLSKSW